MKENEARKTSSFVHLDHLILDMAHNQEEADHHSHHLFMVNLTDHYEEATCLERKSRLVWQRYGTIPADC